MCRLCPTILFVFALVWLSGCDPSKTQTGPQIAKVKGTATIDGKPIPAGELHFVLPGVPPKVVEVRDGAFAGEAAVGANKVEAFIYVEGAASEKYGGTRSKTNVVPQKYWGPHTALSAEVAPGDANQFKFSITSK